MDILQFILNLGPPVMLPIMLIFLGLIFRIPFANLMRSALTVGVAFAGIFLVLGFLLENVGTAAQTMANNFDAIKLDVIDGGWPVSAAISFGTQFTIWVILLTIVVNAVMLIFNWTKVVYVDLWNYWHFIFTAALVYHATNSYILAMIGAFLTIVTIIKLGDWTAPKVQEFMDMPGIALPHTESVSWAFPAIWLNSLIDKIPLLNKITFETNSNNKFMRVLTEPIFLSFFLGSMIGFFAKYPLDKILILSINTATAMILLPRMVKILMEGLVPFAEGVRDFFKKYFPNKEVYLGLDAAVAVGDTNVITTALLSIPLTVLIAFILPGNRVLPFVDLGGALPVLSVWPVIASKGNKFRALLINCIFICCYLWIATALTPDTTEIANSISFEIPQGASEVSSIDAGAHLIPYIYYKILGLFSNFKLG